MANRYLKGYKPLTQFNTPFRQTWEIIKWRNIAFMEIAELLHRQLMRKGRQSHYESYYHPMYGQVYTIAIYDIKSESKAPYNYHSHNDLGLNQFFVGQNPHSWYDGDPGDENGIYHDTCEIIRKEDNATSTKYGYKDLSLIRQWGQGEMVHTLHPVFNPFKDREYIYRFPVKAKISCTFEWDETYKSSKTIMVHRKVTIDMERWKIKLDGSRQRVADIRDLKFNKTFYAYDIYIGSGDKQQKIPGYGKSINLFQNLPEFYRELKNSRVYTVAQMAKLIGQTLEWELVLNGDDDIADIYLDGKYAGRLVAFGSGKVDVYPEEGRVVGYLDDGRILIQGPKWWPSLTLIETFDPATHMPTRGAFKFVTEWESHYKLNVVEDQEAWEKFVPIAVIIIAIVVTIITVGTMTAQTAAAGSAAVGATTAGTTAAGAGAAAATSAGFYSASASALAAIGITSAAGTLALSSIFLSALGYGLSYAGAKHGKEGLIIGGRIASFAGAAMGVASIGASISSAFSTATSQAVANSSGCYLTQMALNGGGAISGGAATGLINSGMSITTNLGVTTVNSGMGVVSVGTANSSVLFVNGVAMSGTGVIGSMAAQFGVSMTTATELLSLSNIATTTYSIGNNIYNAYNGVSDVISSLRGEPVDPDIPQNQSDEEALAGGNGAIGVSPSVVMRFERDIMPADLGLDQDSLIYVRSLLKAYILGKGNLANLVDNIIQTRLRKRYAPLIPSNV